ncbi:unnamed protein product [Eruca vesicaria subsp. sativa]|uniref:Uncharacterized protein n=1 Tax=Eruca vesicaria subsp. sativa TaxID=29727 RepID=A0ABC8LJA5_ERUVS|nr:unnamed protein product [Eruca vesicaria subsp. sativa]
MEEILATIDIVTAATIFIVLSFSIYLAIRIITGKSIHNKEYSPIHATVFDLLFQFPQRRSRGRSLRSGS